MKYLPWRLSDHSMKNLPPSPYLPFLPKKTWKIEKLNPQSINGGMREFKTLNWEANNGFNSLRQCGCCNEWWNVNKPLVNKNFSESVTHRQLKPGNRIMQTKSQLKLRADLVLVVCRFILFLPAQILSYFCVVLHYKQCCGSALAKTNRRVHKCRG